MIWKNNNVMVRPMAVLLQTIRRSSSRKKNITSPSLFRCTSKKKPPLPKSKKQKTTSPFRGLLVPPPKKKNVWKMILSLFNSSTKHLPPTFFKVRTGTHWEPGQHSWGQTRPKQTMFFVNWDGKVPNPQGGVQKKKEQKNKKHVFNTDMGREMRISVNLRSFKKESWFYQAAEMCFMTLTEIPDAFALQNEGDCYGGFALGTSRVSGGYMIWSGRNGTVLHKQIWIFWVKINCASKWSAMKTTQFVKGENDKFIFDISQQQRKQRQQQQRQHSQWKNRFYKHTTKKLVTIRGSPSFICWCCCCR